MKFVKVAAMTVLATYGAALVAQASANQTRPRHVSFVACPVYRNTTRQCWLARNDGKMYFIDPGTGYRPQLGFRVLVEGQVSEAPDVCGGIVLNPVHVSVLPTIDKSCETILPASGFAPPPPNNNYGYFPHPGDAPLSPYIPGEAMPVPVPPYEDRRYSVFFSFNRAFLPEGYSEVIVEQAAVYAIASHARRVTVIGHAASTLLTNGHTMVESRTIAEERARLVAGALVDLGVPADTIETKWKSDPAPGNGADDADRRQASIEIER